MPPGKIPNTSQNAKIILFFKKANTAFFLHGPWKMYLRSFTGKQKV